MESMKQYILFNVLWVSFMLWTALDRTLSATYFGDRQNDATLFWWGSLLLSVVFAIGLYYVRKAGTAGHAKTSPSSKARVAWLISILAYGVLVVLHVQRVLERIPAPHLPLADKIGFASLTMINLGAWLWWTWSSYQEWRSRRTSFVSAF